jgi:hypothetical protein
VGLAKIGRELHFFLKKGRNVATRLVCSSHYFEKFVWKKDLSTACGRNSIIHAMERKIRSENSNKIRKS